MENLGPRGREICFDEAVKQFMSLYAHISRHALIYILPSTPGFQDQPYVSNLGLVLPHYEVDTVVLSRFRSTPRVGEEQTGANFFQLMNFNVVMPPETFCDERVYFEGEADLKHVRDNLYIGAHGMRTSRSALRWMSACLGMEIIPFGVTDPYLYHLDCCFLRITQEAVLLCTEVADPASLRVIERHCEVIDVSLEHARAGITNNLLLSGEILCDSPVSQLSKQDPSYLIEKTKIRRLESICSRFSRKLHIFCMSEFYKSGALLSCLVMHIKQHTESSGDSKSAYSSRRSSQGSGMVAEHAQSNCQEMLNFLVARAG